MILGTQFQLGLNVASPYGCQLIKETKTWILRCYACKETTPDMTKKFCPRLVQQVEWDLFAQSMNLPCFAGVATLP